MTEFAHRTNTDAAGRISENNLDTKLTATDASRKVEFNSDEIGRIYKATNIVGVSDEPFRKRSRASVTLSSLSR